MTTNSIPGNAIFTIFSSTPDSGSAAGVALIDAIVGLGSNRVGLGVSVNVGITVGAIVVPGAVVGVVEPPPPPLPPPPFPPPPPALMVIDCWPFAAQSIILDELMS